MAIVTGGRDLTGEVCRELMRPQDDIPLTVLLLENSNVVVRSLMNFMVKAATKKRAIADTRMFSTEPEAWAHLDAPFDAHEAKR